MMFTVVESTRVYQRQNGVGLSKVAFLTGMSIGTQSLAVSLAHKMLLFRSGTFLSPISAENDISTSHNDGFTTGCIPTSYSASIPRLTLSLQTEPYKIHPIDSRETVFKARV
jgi:hypothetical protein